MRLSKSQSRIIALVGVLATFVFLGTLLRKRDAGTEIPMHSPDDLSSVKEQPLNEVTAPALATPTPQGPSLVLEKFHRVETKDGQTVWEVKADRGSYAPESNVVTIENATLWLFKGEGKSVELTAPRAILNLDGTSLKKAVAYDGVRVLLNKEILTTTDSAEFNQVDNTITASGAVVIEHSRLKIKGTALTVNLDTQVFELASNVDTVVLPERQ